MLHIQGLLARSASKTHVKVAQNLAARWCCRAALVVGVCVPSLWIGGCSNAPADKPGEPISSSVAALGTTGQYDVTFRLWSVTPGDYYLPYYIGAGPMQTRLGGVAFPSDPVESLFFSCGNEFDSTPCGPNSWPQFFPVPSRPFPSPQNCPNIPLSGGQCARWVGWDSFDNVSWMRHTTYTSTGSTTVPLTVTFSDLQSFDYVANAGDSNITLMLDLSTQTVTPVLPTRDFWIGDILANCPSFTSTSPTNKTTNPPNNCYCAIFNGMSDEPRICFVVDINAVTTSEVVVPYQIETLLYLPPFNVSTANYGVQNTIGTSETWTWTYSNSDGLGGSVNLGGVKLGADGSFTVTYSSGNSVSTQASASWSPSIGLPPASSTPCNTASCDFSNDPNHDFDTFYLQLGIQGTQTDRGALGKEVALDLSTGTSIHLSVGDLKQIVQGNWGGIDSTVAALWQQYNLQPSDAQQIMDQDAYVSGMAIDQHPERFEPACLTPGPCSVPHRELVQRLGPQDASTGVTLNQVFGSGTGNSTGFGTGVKLTVSAGVSVGDFGFTDSDTMTMNYMDVTTNTDFTSRSAGVTFKNTSSCESGTVDLWLDKAFGTLLWVTNIQNECAALPMRTMSFERPSDWQIQGGTATLSDNAISGGRSLAITANGSTQLTSIPLSSALLRGAATSTDLSKVSFALNIPTQQPNPLAIGTAQMYISSPTANVSNVDMGQVQLTGLPQGQFVRLGFTIPASALPALTQDNPDVTFTIVLNVSPGTSGWLVDDLQIGCSTCGACTTTCAQGTVCTSGAECGSLVCTIDTAHIPYGTCQAPACAPKCDLGAGCGANTDCVSQICNAGVCKAPACSPMCPEGAVCDANADCEAGICANNVCVAPTCAPNCGQGVACGANAECGSKVCTNGVCSPPACSPTCAEGAVCGANSDCTSGICTNGMCAPPACSPHCNQGTPCASSSECGSQVCTNGTCQAPTCAPKCHLGAGCGANTDCVSQICNAGVCQAPACSPMCGEGAVCDANADCEAHICTNNVCAAPNCSPNCGQGSACGASTECGSKVCTNGLCAPPACSPHCAVGASCGALGDCATHVCTGGLCRTCGPNCNQGAVCSGNGDCESRICTGGVCHPPSCAPHCNQGTFCGANSDCGSQVCTGGLCEPPACSHLCAPGAACGVNADCASLVCTNNLCRAPSCSPHCNDGAACGVSGDCSSRVCTNGTCKPPACSPHCAKGAACGVNSECASQVCNNGVCR
jgi:hypothetical protein